MDGHYVTLPKVLEPSIAFEVVDQSMLSRLRCTIGRLPAGYGGASTVSAPGSDQTISRTYNAGTTSLPLDSSMNTLMGATRPGFSSGGLNESTEPGCLVPSVITH